MFAKWAIWGATWAMGGWVIKNAAKIGRALKAVASSLRSFLLRRGLGVIAGLVFTAIQTAGFLSYENRNRR